MAYNEPITVNCPNLILRNALKRHLENRFQVSIRIDHSDIIISGKKSELILCQEKVDYFNKSDCHFILSLNQYSKEALRINSVRYFFETNCNVLMTIDGDILNIFGSVNDTSRVNDYFFHYNRIVDKNIDFDFSEEKELSLRRLCHDLGISIDWRYLCSMRSKVFIYLVLKDRAELTTTTPIVTANNETDDNQCTTDGTLSDWRCSSDQETLALHFSLAASLNPTAESNTISGCNNTNEHPSDYKTIIIDGEDIANGHGKGRSFSCIGIKIAVDFFVQRGYSEVYAVLPRHRQWFGEKIFQTLRDSNRLKYTPSRIINNVREAPHFANLIFDAVIATGGVLVSNDQYQSLTKIEKYQDIIAKRLIHYSFKGDSFELLSESIRFQSQPQTNFVKAKKPKEKPKTPQTSTKKPILVPNNSKISNSTKSAKCKPLYKTDLEGHQIDLYQRAQEVFPTNKSLVKQIIVSNPNINDLNRIIELIITAVDP